MRKFILLVWLLLPVLAGAYHYGPGQEQLALDRVANLISTAEALAADKKWAEAEATYEEALTELPASQVSINRRLRLERAKAQMFVKKLPVAHQELKTLVDEMQEDEKADPKLASEARASLANAQYYMTWLMRLEGKPEQEWKPEIEAARQAFRLLADEANRSGDQSAIKRHREDLESSIRLARMELTELQGLPLPSQ